MNVSFAWISAPVLFHVFTISEWVPAATAVLHDSVFVLDWHFATPSM
jgi:hypothetical protein